MSKLLSNANALGWGAAIWRRLHLSLAQVRRRLHPAPPPSPCSQLAESLAGELTFASLENSIASKTHLAVRHRYAGTYRGFYLYTDAAGRVALIDSGVYQYLTLCGGEILLIEGLPAARRFIDELEALRNKHLLALLAVLAVREQARREKLGRPRSSVTAHSVPALRLWLHLAATTGRHEGGGIECGFHPPAER
jgi:hypothetical protein